MENKIYSADDINAAMRYQQAVILKDRGRMEQDDPMPYLANSDQESLVGKYIPDVIDRKSKPIEENTWDKFKNFVWGNTGNDAEQVKQNKQLYNKGMQEELANKSAPGTYWFGYNNPAEFTPDRVAKAIANGDLKEKNMQLYRRYFDQAKGQMLYESIPVASFGEQGQVKPYKYDATVLENLDNIKNKVFSGDLSAISPTAKRLQYGEKEFQQKARNAPDANSIGEAVGQGLNTFLDAFNPADVLNTITDRSKFQRSNIEKLRDRGDNITLVGAGQFVGEAAGGLGKMIAGTAIGGPAMGALLPEIGEHTLKAMDSNHYLGEMVNMAEGAGLNRLGMKVGQVMGDKILPALADKGIKAGLGAIGKSVAAQLPVDATQAAIDLYAQNVSDADKQKMVYGKEVGSSDFLKNWGMQSLMSVGFNALFDIVPQRKILWKEGIARGSFYDKLDNEAAKIARQNPGMSHSDIKAVVNSSGDIYGAKTKWSKDALEASLKKYSGLTDPEMLANSVIQNVKAGVDVEDIVNKAVKERIVADPDEVSNLRNAARTIEELHQSNPDAELEAYKFKNEDGKESIGYRFKDKGLVETPAESNIDMVTKGANDEITLDTDGNLHSMDAESSGKIVNILNDMDIRGQAQIALPQIKKLFPMDIDGHTIWSDEMGVRRLLSLYASITGESAVAKSGKQKTVGDVISRVIHHLEPSGESLPKYWKSEGNKGYNIDKQASRESGSNDIINNILAYGDRKLVIKEMLESKDFPAGMPKQKKLEIIGEIYGVKQSKKGTWEDMIAQKAMENRESYEGMWATFGTGIRELNQTGTSSLPTSEVKAPDVSTAEQIPIEQPIEPTRPITQSDLIGTDMNHFVNKDTGEAYKYTDNGLAPAVISRGDMGELTTDVAPSAYANEPIGNIETAYGYGIPQKITDKYLDPSTGLEIENPTIQHSNQGYNSLISGTINGKPVSADENSFVKYSDLVFTKGEGHPNYHIVNDPKYTKKGEVVLRSGENTLKPVKIDKLIKDGFRVVSKNGVDMTDALMNSSVFKKARTMSDKALPSIIKEDAPLPSLIGEDIPAPLEQPKLDIGAILGGLRKADDSVKPITNVEPEIKPIAESIDNNTSTDKMILGNEPKADVPNETKVSNETSTVESKTPIEPIDNTKVEPVEATTIVKEQVVAEPEVIKGEPYTEEVSLDKEKPTVEEVKPIEQPNVTTNDKVIPDVSLVGGKLKIEKTPSTNPPIDNSNYELGHPTSQIEGSKQVEPLDIKPTTDLISLKKTKISDVKSKSTKKIREEETSKLVETTQGHDKVIDDLAKTYNEKEPFITDEKIETTTPDRIDGEPAYLTDKGKETLSNQDEAYNVFNRIFPDKETKETITQILRNDMSGLGFIVTVSSKKTGADNKEIQIRRKSGNAKGESLEFMESVRDRAAELLGLTDKEKSLFTIGTNSITFTGKKNKTERVKKVNPEILDNNRATLYQDLLDLNPGKGVEMKYRRGEKTGEIKIPNSEAYNEVVSKLEKNGWSKEDVEGTISPLIVEAIGKGGATLRFPLDLDKSYIRQQSGLLSKESLKNPIVVGTVLNVIGGQLDNDERESGIGKAMKYTGTAMMAYGAYKYGIKYTKNIGRAIRSTDGKSVVGIIDAISNAKNNPIAESVVSELSSLNRSNIRNSIKGLKEKLTYDKLYSKFEATERAFSKGSTALISTLAHIRGEFANDLQLKAAQGKIDSDRFFHQVNTMKEDFEKSIGKDLKMEAAIAKTNDDIYKKTTDISNSIGDPKNPYTKEQKKAMIAEVTTPDAIQKTLLSNGVDNTKLVDAYNAYEKFREIQNTTTQHHMRAYLRDNGINIEDSKMLTDKFNRTLAPMQSDAIIMKQNIRELKNELKNATDRTEIKIINKKIKVEKAALASVASEMKLVNNKMKVIAYANDFIDRSSEMHHLIGRWDLSKKDNPKGFSVYEVAKNEAGRYIRTNDVTSAENEMHYYPTNEIRNGAEKEWMDKRNPQPIEGQPKIYKVTGDDGKEYLVRVENNIDNDAAKTWNTTNVAMVRQRILAMLKSENDIPKLKGMIMKEFNEATKASSGDWNGDLDIDSISQLNDLADTAKQALESVGTRNEIINSIKDAFYLTLQPKARPMYRNKNVKGYEPTDMQGWSNMWRTGLEKNTKDIGNRYMSSSIRNEIESQLLSANQVGFHGKYTDHLMSMLGDLNNSNINQSDYWDKIVKGKTGRSIKAAEKVLVMGTLAWNTVSGMKNLIQGNLGTAISLVSEGMNVKNMANATKGLVSAVRGKSTATPYKDEMLDLLHNSIIDSRIPYSTSVEHMKSVGGTGKIGDKLMAVQRYGETINRYLSAMSYGTAMMQEVPYEQFAGKMSKSEYINDVLLKSTNFTYATQGNFDYMYRTDIEKGLLKKVPMGEMFLTLQAPAINQIVLYGNLLKRGMNSDEFGKKAIAGAIAMGMMVPLIGGVTAIPGASDLMSAIDIIGGGGDITDEHSKMLQKTQDDIEDMCQSITGSKNVAKFLGKTYRAGILSAISDVNLSQDASFYGMLVPFFAQKMVKAVTTDLKAIGNATNMVDEIAKIMLKNVPLAKNIVRAGNQLDAGHFKDANGNYMRKGYGIGDAAREVVLGNRLGDALAAQDSWAKEESLTTPQGVHAILNNLRSYSGITFGSSAGNKLAKERITKQLTDGEAVAESNRNELKAMKINTIMSDTKKKIDEWKKEDPERAARIAGKWLENEDVNYQGLNKDAESIGKSLESKANGYYKAVVLSKTINNLAGIPSKVTYDNEIVDYNGAKVRLGSIPFEERGYYHAIGTDKNNITEEKKYGVSKDR